MRSQKRDYTRNEGKTRYIVRSTVVSFLLLATVLLAVHKLSPPSASVSKQSAPKGATKLPVLDGRNSLKPFCDEVLPARVDRREIKKIIAYSLFRRSDTINFHSFFDGIRWNIREAQLYYPEWIVRVYTLGLSHEEEEALLNVANNVELVRCNLSSAIAISKSRMMITRFLAYDDPRVTHVLSRDADSRFSPRELFAVNEWLATGVGFHVMRDHRFHSTEVLGGMFGIRRGALGNHTMMYLVHKAVTDHQYKIPGETGEDQHFLSLYVWPIVKYDTLSHDIDAFRCEVYGAAMCKDFPFGDRDERANYFVGAALQWEKDSSGQTPAGYNCSYTCKLRSSAPLTRTS